MVRNLAIILAVALIGFLALMLLGAGGALLSAAGGQGAAGGVLGTAIAGVVLFCVAILLAFVFVGVGLLILGIFVLVGLILAAVAFPFMLPLLIPLFIVWIFCGIARRKKSA
jgi:hypothetical protein